MTADSPPINRQRRRFGIGLGVGLGAATAVSSAARAATARVAANTLPSLVKPRALRTGDLVALVAPGGVVDDALIEKGVRNLESIGLRVLLAPHLRARHGNFAGTVRERLADLHALLEHREVTALWALRGGSGCASLLPHLRYDLIRRQRKIIIGYSDITALTAAVVRHAGLVCFHGPVASSTFSEFSVAHLRALLFDAAPQHVMSLAPENVAQGERNAEFRARVLRGGTLHGRLAGGNLSVVAALAGTPYAPVLNGALLFLEEIGEAPYRIDRMLTQLRQGGALEHAGGIMLGVFRNCSPRDGEASLSLAETIDEHIGMVDITSVYGYSFGHIAHQYTLPVGALATVNPQAATVTVLEAATSRD